MKVPQKQLKKWIKALRSGEYKQSTKRLQTDRGYCCLGVACKVLIPKEKQLLHQGRLDGGMPSTQHSAPGWLKEISRNVFLITGIALIDYNDIYKFKFNEIADLLEQLYLE